MTAAPAEALSSNGERSDAELRAAARATYRAALAAGQPITGAELGRRFGLSDRWGRARVAEVRRNPAEGDDGARPSTRAAQPHRETDPPSADRAAGPVTPHAPRGRRALTGSAAGPADPPSTGREAAWSWLDSVITLLVALVAAAASYGHMLHVALLAGEPLWIARAWPITVDGLVLAALRQRDRGRGWLVLGTAVSVAANVLAQFPDLAVAAGPVVSAWPPIGLYGTHRLLHNRKSPASERAVQPGTVE